MTTNIIALLLLTAVAATAAGANEYVDLNQGEIRAARALMSANPALSSAEIASRVAATEIQRDHLIWMRDDLEKYATLFSMTFSQKLRRCKSSHFRDADHFEELFVGPDRPFRAPPADADRAMLARGGTLFVDCLGVPFFNTALQTHAAARRGIADAIEALTVAIEADFISQLDFFRLLAIFSRPEFDDLRRYHVQMFPDASAQRRFGAETSPAAALGRLYPKEAFVVSNDGVVHVDVLSFSLGQHVHYLGLLSQREVVGGDGREFVGTVDFLEHDFNHAADAVRCPPTGDVAHWARVHAGFQQVRDQYDDPERLLASVAYFHLTHECAYHLLLEGDRDATDAYEAALTNIMFRFENANDLDGFREAAGDSWRLLLPDVYKHVFEYVRGHFEAALVDDNCATGIAGDDNGRKESDKFPVEQDGSSFVNAVLDA